MNLPVTVERTAPPAATADAFLLPDAVAERLGECVAALSAPRVHRVRGGLLLVPPAATAVSPPGLLRLKRAAADLFIPIDAVLSPALLPDEFPGLTRSGGLVLLPTAALAFHPTAPLPASSWLAAPPSRADVWAAFPPPPPGADTLRVIERPSPPVAIVEILGGGEPDDRSPLPDNPAALPDDARPPAGTFLRQLGAGAVMGVAGALAWLGRQLGAGGLARMGANLARRAIEQVPRLSERVLGAQEAALRELLRQLQTGDVEKALRRAPIAVADPNQRGSVAGGASLGDRDTRFSLADLLRGGGGAASVWVGGGDVWGLLQAEYRRLAEEAVKRGDYRRAAYLWGVLLRDLRSAANVLKTGGLYRDAARLLRDKLNDPTGAAAAFELAGDFDEAVRLYERAGEDLKAAELLRRIGDEERAVAFFRAAADKMAGRQEYLQAGDLLRAKLGRADLANGYYLAGWDAGRPDAVTCGERLIDDSLVRERWDDFDRLLDEAERKYAAADALDAGRFFNYALRVSPDFLPADRHADLKDRVRLLFADHLRAAGRAKSRVDELFGGWSPAVRRDAAFAVHQTAPAVAVPKAKPLADGTVRAVAYSPGGGRIFIGTDDTITAWDVRTGVSGVVAHTWKGELLGLCADDDGRRVYGLLDQTAHLRLIACQVPATPGQATVLASADIPCQDPRSAFLQPRCFGNSIDDAVVVAVDGERHGYHGHTLTTVSTRWFRNTCGATHWIGQTRDVLWAWDDGVLAGWRRHITNHADYFASIWQGSLGWTPTAGVGIQPAVDWFAPDDTTLVLAGVGSDGELHRSEVTFGGAERVEPRHQSATDPDGWAAVALVRGTRLAAVTRSNRLFVFRPVGGKLVPAAGPFQVAVPHPVVYLAAHPATDELVVVTSRGAVLKMPTPADGTS